jgi:phage baseplate assembly protein W
MIPSTNTILSTELEVKKQPSKDYKLHIERNTINGFCDGLEAMKQIIYKILNTERYEYIMYSWNYGIELVDLYGEPVTYVCPEVQRRITEALIQDDRIESVDNFEFDTSEKRTVKVTFTVHTIFGNVESEKVVNF